MSKKLLTAVVMSLVITPVFASDWVSIGKSSDKLSEYYFDRDSVKEVDLQGLGSKTIISAFIQRTYLKGNPDRAKTGIYYSKQHWYFSCNEGKLSLNGYINYNTKDKVIDSSSGLSNYYSTGSWGIAYPDTVGEAILIAVCGAYEDKSIY